MSKFNQSEQPIKAVTIKDGYWFYFDDDGKQIAAHGSAYSGKESIFFEQKLVSQQRNILSRICTHHFEEDCQKYKVVFEMTSILSGTLECRLYKNRKLVDTQTKAFIEGPKSFFKFLAKSFGIGLIFGVVGMLAGFLIVKYFL